MAVHRLVTIPRFQFAAVQLKRCRRFTVSAHFKHAESPASAVASSFFERFQSLGPQTRTQYIDSNQLQLLTLTLNRPSLFPTVPSPSNSATNLPAGTPVPPGYHLVYFTPAFLESELGADGTDASYNPEAPFTRRMWAGGEVIWPRGADGKPNLLRVGQKVQETTKVLSAEAKVVKKTGEDMIVVGVEKVFTNENGVSIIDKRNWVFRKALPALSALSATTPDLPSSMAHISRPKVSEISTSGNTHKRSMIQTPVSLFRFSALTFNPHKIHYSTPWAREVEGHRDVVVHGPLNLISILDLWRDVNSTEDPTLVVPRRISYRATSPLYAGEEYTIELKRNGAETDVQILGPGGVLSMKAGITS